MQQYTDIASSKLFPDTERLREITAEEVRIARMLLAYVDAENAGVAARRLFAWAMQLDVAVNVLKSHPTIQGKWKYDGTAFTRKTECGFFCVLPDGLHFLRSLQEYAVRCFFEPCYHGGIEALLNWREEQVKVYFDRLSSVARFGDLQPNDEAVGKFEQIREDLKS